MSVISVVFSAGNPQDRGLRGRRILSRGKIRGGGEAVERRLDRVFLGCRPHGFDAGGGSPLFHDQDSGGGIVLDGVIDNRRDLAAALELEPGGQRLPSDARLVFEAYRRWGRDCCSKLVGAFAFAIWDPREQGLFCARDPFGIRTLYYTEDGSFFAVASQVRQLVENAPDALDEEFLADYLTQGIGVQPRTPFPGICRLESAHALWYDGRRATCTRYWDPRELSPFSHQDEGRFRAEFRELFRESIGCAVKPDTPILCDLSGGLDSSSIACTLGELLASEGETVPVHTMTYILGRRRDAREAEWIAEIRERYGFEGEELIVDDILMSDPWSSADQWDEPDTTLFSYPLFEWYVEVAERVGATSLLSGLGGEAVVGSEGPVPVHLADLLLSLRLPSFFRQLRVWRRGLHMPLINLLAEAVFWPTVSNRYRLMQVRKNEVPAWIAPDFAARTGYKRRALGSWCDLKCPTRELQRRVERLYRISGFLQRGNLEHSMLVRYPFLHLPLVEYVLRVPFEYKSEPIETRKLLRRSMADVLPDRLWRRLLQPTGNPFVYHAFERQWSSLEPVVRDPVLADLGVVDRSEFQRAMKLARIGHSTHTVPLLGTLALEFWARQVLGVEIGTSRVA